MPNYVYTRCTITGATEDVEAFRARMLASRTHDQNKVYTSVDFNKIVKRIPPVGTYGQRLLLSGGMAKIVEPWQDFLPDREGAADRLNWRFGLNRLFSWCAVENDEPLEFICTTSWDFPEGIFEALAGEFPSLHFNCVAVEDQENFAGAGYFNPPEGQKTWAYCDFSEDLYERVWNEKYYGHLKEEENV